MQTEVLRQRELVDQIMERVKELMDLNNSIADLELRTDMICLIGQHRHAFEDQNVADHTECISIAAVCGSFEGITGGLMMLGDNQTQAERAIVHAAMYFSSPQRKRSRTR